MEIGDLNAANLANPSMKHAIPEFIGEWGCGGGRC